MKASRPRALTVLISGLGLLAAAPVALAQAVQNLTVAYENFLPVAPLSDWLTAGIALLLAASAMVVLRRQQGRAGRLFGWLLAVVAGATLFTALGQRTMSDAHATPAPAISLVTSPGSLDVLPYFPSSPLDVVVTNNSGQTARITAIDLDSLNFVGTAAGVQQKEAIVGEYVISPASTCAVGTVLSVGNTCTIRLIVQIPS